MTEVVAVVPTFRPHGPNLRALLAVLRRASVPTIVPDDASPATYDRLLRTLPDSNAQVVRHARNAGIARSLNEGFRFADAHEAAWLLTLDQDTSITTEVIDRLLQVTKTHDRIGVVGVEVIGDASGDLTYPSQQVDDLTTTEEVFQTASVWRVSALREIGGFDERLGIDGVDAAACLRLRERGWRVALAPGTRVPHRYGSGTQVRILGRMVVSTGHSPARRESMVRNRLALAPAEFRQSPRHALRTLRRVAVNTLLGVTIEEHRLANLAGSLRGLRSPGRD